jgi:outer membrane protein OmpA-like peptidoglycan-associated protein
MSEMKKIIFACAAILFCGLVYGQEYETLNEEFNNNSLKWPVEDGDQLRTKITDGTYRIENLSDKFQLAGLNLPVDPNFDFTIETSMGRSPESTSNLKSVLYGFCLGYGGTNYLLFMLNSEKKIVIGRSISGETKILFSEKSDAVYPDQKNILTIEKKSDGIKFLVNGKVIYNGNGYSHDGTTFYYCLSNKEIINVDYLKINRKKMKINLVENPINGYKLENLGKNINSEYSELSPVISTDGKSLFIVRQHPENLDGEKVQEIWFSEKEASGEWGKVRNIGKPLNNSSNNAVISITPDGNSLLLKDQYNADGSYKGNGVSISKKREGEWQMPENQDIINLKNTSRYVNYCLSPDGLRFILSINNENSLGGRDLFICFLLEDGRWSEPKNMGNILNTFAGEGTPFIAPDGKTLYFSSYGHPGYGEADIFVSRRLDDTWLNWSEPQNLGPEINSEGFEAYFTLPAQGDYAYMVSANPEFSLGVEDIFRIKLSKSASIDPVVMVSGYVYNKKTNKIINAQISYENLSTGKEVGRAFSTVENGYKIALPRGSVYGYRAQADSFVSVNENLDLSSLETYTEKKMNLYLVPMERGQTIRLNNIFFDYDKSELKPESIPELSRLIVLMKQNPAMKIEITGHTDNLGANEYNFKLAGDRAAAVKNYVITNGIDKTRVTSKSYGETKPIATNETEEGRQQNRRVEFVIL